MAIDPAMLLQLLGDKVPPEKRAIFEALANGANPQELVSTMLAKHPNGVKIAQLLDAARRQQPQQRAHQQPQVVYAAAPPMHPGTMDSLVERLASIDGRASQAMAESQRVALELHNVKATLHTLHELVNQSTKLQRELLNRLNHLPTEIADYLTTPADDGPDEGQVSQSSTTTNNGHSEG